MKVFVAAFCIVRNEMMKYPFAIFDMDGTLLDSMGYWRNLGGDYLKQRGIEVPKDLQDKLRAKSLEESARLYQDEFGLTEPIEEIIEGFYALIADNYRYRIQLKPGVMEFLQDLKNAGVKMCIATATYEQVAMPALERLGILPFFEFVMDCRKTGGKTSPAVYDAAAARLGGDRKNTMVFEDAPHAVKTAHEAGYYVVGIHEPVMIGAEEQIKEIADYYIKNYQYTEVRQHFLGFYA